MKPIDESEAAVERAAEALARVLLKFKHIHVLSPELVSRWRASIANGQFTGHDAEVARQRIEEEYLGPARAALLAANEGAWTRRRRSSRPPYAQRGEVAASSRTEGS